MNETIQVTTHVARDFLQNAAYFNTLPKAVWEYISNSIDAYKEGKPIVVIVELHDQRSISISDNGIGMSREDLKRFFTVHGENIQRKRGKQVRGRFGTGKVAAFGIARKLRIDTNQNSIKNVVELSFEKIKEANDGKPFSVNEIIVNQGTSEDDGTTITISDFIIRDLDMNKTISYIEKHLSRIKTKAEVYINGSKCNLRDQPYVLKYEILPSDDIKQRLGEVSLTIKVSPYNLERDENGIDIFSNGIWHELTLGDVKGEQSAKLFGEVDIPCFEEEETEIPAFDNTRNNTLNRENYKVVVALAWISQELEKIRQLLILEEKEKNQGDEARRLEKEANKIANILNDDFREKMEELELSQNILGKRRVKTGITAFENGEVYPGEGNQESKWEEGGFQSGNGKRGNSEPSEGEAPREGPSFLEGSSSGSPGKLDDNGKYKKRRGGFLIKFDHHTSSEFRSKYMKDEKIIYINLDHPQIQMSFEKNGDNLDAPGFLQMAYEIASVEYAQALEYERIEAGAVIEPTETLFSINETIDRISRKLAELMG